MSRAARPLAPCAFSLLVPADSRIGRKLPVEASRLPVGQAGLDSVASMVGNLCPTCGERVVTFSRVKAERGCDISLVDDAFTAGTTVSGRAWALRRAGVASVHAPAVARALKADRIGIQREAREAA